MKPFQNTEDEYCDEQLVKKQIHRNKRKCGNIQKDKSRNTVSGRKKLSSKIQFNEDEVVAPESQRECDEVVSAEIQKDSCEQRLDYKKMGKRRWDRRNACFYCQELVTNYSRHLLRKHPKEIEVINYKSINDVDLKVRKQKRQEITDKLRNKGNFLHNSKVCFDRDGEKTILPVKRNTQESSPSAFATCKMCLGTFKRSTFFRHFRKCGAGANDCQTPRCRKRVLYNNSITIIPRTESASVELRDKILPHLRSDEISLVVKNDPLILAYGSRLLKKKKERRSRKAICSKMRDLATLLIVLRKKDNSIETLTDVLDPEKYDIFIDGIKTMCGFDEETGFVKVTSIPARMRPAILGCIDILYTQSIMSTESTAYKDVYKKELDDFKRLVEINWEWEISSNAEKTRKRKNMTKENIIPLEEDIATVMEKIHKLEAKYAQRLKRNRDGLNYENLCTVTISHIIMLDRKRAGDVAEAELSFYVNRKNEEIPEKILETLTPQQRKSIGELDVFQIPGKRTRSVPILLTKTMRENIDLIIACREDLNIPSSNRYLFARPNTEEPFDGGKCLEKIKKYCNLKRPEMLTSTGMRHHIATMSQIHSKQNDQYTEHLAGFLGHDVTVHAKNYRLPMQVLQKAVVGTQLIEYENTIRSQNKIETVTSQSEIRNQESESPIVRTVIKTINVEDAHEHKKTEVNNNENVKPGNQLKFKKSSKFVKRIQVQVSTQSSSFSDSDENIEANRDDDIEKPIRFEKTRPAKDTTITESEKKVKLKKKEPNADESDDEIKTNSKKQRIKKRPVKVSSSSETESEDKKTHRRKVTHRKWTDEEIKAVKKHLHSYIQKKINPGKAKCMEIFKKEPDLHNRTWMQLNTYVNNIYKKK